MIKDAIQKMQRGSSQRPLMKKEATLKTQRGSSQRPPMKKEATPKHKGLITKTSDEKRGNPKNAKGPSQRPPMKKEKWQPQKCNGAHQKVLRGKKRQPKNFQQTHTLTEASSTHLTVEGNGDYFWFRPQITSRMKATN
jgi:hypothetical protein